MSSITFEPTVEHRKFLDQLRQAAVPIEGKPRAIGRVLNELIQEAMDRRSNGHAKTKPPKTK